MAFVIPQPLFDSLANLDNSIPSLTLAPSPSSKKDFVVIQDYLKQYRSNQSTFESYRREVERLIQWSWLIQKTSVLKLKRQDIEVYINFCLSPPKSWIGLKRVPRFLTTLDGGRKPNPSWRPFVATVTKAEHKNGEIPSKQAYQLSQKAIQEIFTVLNSFYHYALLEEKVLVNPVALIRQKNKFIQRRKTKSTVMRLSEVQWQACLKVAEQMASEMPGLHERTLFVLVAMYLMYLRISEVVASDRWAPQMNHFYTDSQGNWWFKTVGKGNKLREIAVSEAMLNALKRYRASLGLSSLPGIKEKEPLIPKERGKGPITSTRYIRLRLQACFDRAVEYLKENHQAEEAETLMSTTAHWLRHTGISDDINKRGRPVAHVRDDAGHSSSATTDRYNDIERAERHKTAKSKITTSLLCIK